MANSVIAQMLFLEADDPDKDIFLYINSPGGSVSAGLAIYDTMQYLRCEVCTICVGLAASMGAFLLAAGAKGKRKALENAEIMIHQPSGGAQGKATDISIVAEQIIKIEHCLLGVPGATTEDVKTVYSHPQSLMQSSKFLAEHDWQLVSMQNNAKAPGR